ncbi:PucR family transcriptional regulator [Amycolatopsis jejuensis]|uniref:PucR family transcriptional regulator n=1 Tax=Amycolatopsis jejuensis TaxID=330084 RepID=UPI00068A8AA7|nr:helix-turn-helix domain-containing protein [Amycolatopsis jejuensis]
MTNELQHLVDALAQRLRRPVAVDDVAFRLLAYSAHPTDVDDLRKAVVLTRGVPPDGVAWLRGYHLSKATDPVRLPANAALHARPRIAIPVRCQGMHFGCLWLIEHGPAIEDAELAVAASFAGQAGEILFRERISAELESTRTGELIRDLVSDEPATRQSAAASLTESGLFAARGSAVCLVVRTGSADLDEDERLALSVTLDRAAHSLPARECLRMVRPGHGVLVTTETALRHCPELPFSVHRTATRLLGKEDSVVGVGPAAPALADMLRSYRGALQAAQVAHAVPSFRPVAEFGKLGVYGLLADLPSDRLPSPLDTMAHRLREAGLFATAELFLDRAGDVRAVADALSVHRASIYPRLRRIEQITGIDLADGEQRLALHVGIKSARLQRLA